MQQTEVKFGPWMEQGFALYKENLALLILSALLVWLLSVLSLGILAGPMAAGMVLITLRLQDKTEPKPEIGDLFQGFSFFLNAFLFALVYSVVAYVGYFILLFVPMIGPLAAMVYLFALFTLVLFAMFLIVDKKMDFWPAIMASVEKVKTNFWPFLGFTVVISIAGGVGSILCGIGAILTLPFAYCAATVAYRDVFSDAADVGGMPSVESVPEPMPPSLEGPETEPPPA